MRALRELDRVILGCLLRCGETAEQALIDALCGQASLRARRHMGRARPFYARVAREGSGVVRDRLGELARAGLVEVRGGRRPTLRASVKARQALVAGPARRRRAYELLAGEHYRGLALDMVTSTTDTRWLRTEVGRLVYLGKYREDEQSRAELTRRAVGALRRRGWDQHLDLIAPVPPSGKRPWLDLAADAAVRIGAALRIRVGVRVLAATRERTPQKDLAEAEDKRNNVRGAFAVTDVRGVALRRVLLVDDLYDSGATVEECARMLKEAGAGSVKVLALGRARWPR